jgi:hypothetical protein
MLDPHRPAAGNSEDGTMGSMTDANIRTWQQHAGPPASPKRADALERLQSLAFDLIKICELERSGIRDGDGYWHGGEPLGELTRVIGHFELPPIDEPEQRLAVPAGCSAATMDQIAEALGTTKQKIERTGVDMTVLETAARLVEQQFDPESLEAIDELRAKYHGQFVDAVIIAAKYLITGSSIEANKAPKGS